MNEVTENKEYKKEYKRKPYFNIYKPLQQEGMGAALQFSYDNYKRCVFLEAARQQGVKLEIGSKEQFDWENKIVFKIVVADMSQMLLLFARQEKTVKCFHTQPNIGSTSVLEIIEGTYNDKVNYQLKLSKTVDGATRRVSMYISQGEMITLAHFMRESLSRMMGYTTDTDVSEIQHQLGLVLKTLAVLKDQAVAKR